jgi:RimK family alpha-L-glutamate ligase
MPTHTRCYLVNNKDKEPEFQSAFKKVAKRHKIALEDISILDCAFSYDRTSGTVAVFAKNKKLLFDNTTWFVRRWGPSDETTALLSIILKSHQVPFHDSDINTVHEVRTSKLSHTFQLAKKGIASPSTFVVPLQSYSLYKKRIIKSLQYPIVVKARGGLGKRVWQCHSEQELDQKITELTTEGKDTLAIFQEAIPNDGDIRVVVYKNKVLASILRQSSDGFLNNVSQGGTATPITITAKEAKIAIQAARVIGLDLAGVDIVRHNGTALVFEVNKAPDITSFHEAAGFNIAEVIAETFFTA